VLVAGRNERLRQRCELLSTSGEGPRLRVLGWTNRFASLMRAADLMVSKLGNTFDEAVAAEVPVVALEPPPGSERVQYRLLETWGTGRAVRTIDEVEATVAHLLAHREEIDAMRNAAKAHQKLDAARGIAQFLGHGISRRPEAIRGASKESNLKGNYATDETSQVGKVAPRIGFAPAQGTQLQTLYKE
jgi:UDP-N-acetylglucosamine:LPS N-acetylglucosamine transferase